MTIAPRLSEVELGRLFTAIVRGDGDPRACAELAEYAEYIEKDGRVLNSITGHTSDETRRKIYQEKLRDQMLAKAADTRAELRERAMDAARNDPAASSVAERSRWEITLASARAATAYERRFGGQTYPRV